MGRHIMEETINTISVINMGAKGDGVTDDTQAFTDALEYLKSIGGGVLEVPAKETSYLLDGHVVLVDNVTIRSNGAVIEKKASSTGYYAFISLSGTKQGYGSGASNISFEGLTFKGDFSIKKSFNFTLHHSSDVIFRNCKFIQCVVAGHAIDLGGCQNVVIDNCEFYGFYPQTGSEYKEAIQVDHSTASGNTGMDDPASYDGLPTINVSVTNCKFLPITVDGTEYPSPHPFGSHSVVEKQALSNLLFRDNLVKGAPAYPTASGSTNFATGWVHFYGAEDVRIINNEFINVDSRSSRAIGVWTKDTGIPLNQVNVTNPTQTSDVTMAPKNITISGNIFKGFNSADGTSIIYLSGKMVNTTPYYVTGATIEKNTFTDCFSTSGTDDNRSSDCVRLDYVKSALLDGNKGFSIRRLLYATNSSMIKVVNSQLTGAYYIPISINTCSDLDVSHNHLQDFTVGFYFRDIDGISVVSNSFRNGSPSTGYDAAVLFKGCSYLQFKNNTLPGKPNNNVGTGISLYGACSKALVKDNLIYNYADYKIYVSSDSTDVTTS